MEEKKPKNIKDQRIPDQKTNLTFVFGLVFFYCI